MLLLYFAEQRIDGGNRIDLVTPQFDAIGFVLVTRIDLDDITAHPKAAAFEVDVIPFVLQFNQPLQQRVARDPHSGFEKHQHTVVRIRITQTVDARNAGHHDYVASFEQRTRRRHSQPIDVFVDDRIFLDVSV